jgi:hypothetical protein
MGKLKKSVRLKFQIGLQLKNLGGDHDVDITKVSRIVRKNTESFNYRYFRLL